MAKAAFNKKKNHFTSKLDLNLKKKLVKCYIWSMALYGAETSTIRAVDQKHLETTDYITSKTIRIHHALSFFLSSFLPFSFISSSLPPQLL
jgi:hypothetical protein